MRDAQADLRHAVFLHRGEDFDDAWLLGVLEHETVVEFFFVVNMAVADQGGEERLAGLERYGIFFGGEVVAVYAEEVERKRARIRGLEIFRVNLVGRIDY